MIDNIRDLLIRHEGCVPYLYKDSLGYDTIGVGHMVDKRIGGRLSPQVIDLQLSIDIEEARTSLEENLSWFTALDPVRQAVLIDMCFNLGPEPFDSDGFKDWPIFVEQVRTAEYDKAADNMLSTLWARQVGPRASRLAKMIRSGQWPEY